MSVESEEQLLATAHAVKDARDDSARGAYKPRTLAYEFQGFGKEVALFTNGESVRPWLKIITNCSAKTRRVTWRSGDILQVAHDIPKISIAHRFAPAAANRAAKRGMARVEDGCSRPNTSRARHGNVMLCERGIRRLKRIPQHARLAAVALQKENALPVIVDPSRGAAARTRARIDKGQ